MPSSSVSSCRRSSVASKTSLKLMSSLFDLSAPPRVPSAAAFSCGALDDFFSSLRSHWPERARVTVSGLYWKRRISIAFGFFAFGCGSETSPPRAIAYGSAMSCGWRLRGGTLRRPRLAFVLRVDGLAERGVVLVDERHDDLADQPGQLGRLGRN